MPCTSYLMSPMTDRAKGDAKVSKPHLKQSLQTMLFDVFIDSVLHLVQCVQCVLPADLQSRCVLSSCSQCQAGLQVGTEGYSSPLEEEEEHCTSSNSVNQVISDRSVLSRRMSVVSTHWGLHMQQCFVRMSRNLLFSDQRLYM